MKRNSERLYWMTNNDWYRINKQKDCFELTEVAPERAKRSFAMWNRPDKPSFFGFLRRCKMRLL